MINKIVLHRGLVGEKSLIAAIVAVATNDAVSNKNNADLLNAWSYFGGPVYKNHLSWLGLPGETMPAAIEHMASDQLLEITDLILKEGLSK